MRGEIDWLDLPEPHKVTLKLKVLGAQLIEFLASVHGKWETRAYARSRRPITAQLLKVLAPGVMLVPDSGELVPRHACHYAEQRRSVAFPGVTRPPRGDSLMGWGAFMMAPSLNPDRETAIIGLATSTFMYLPIIPSIQPISSRAALSRTSIGNAAR